MMATGVGDEDEAPIGGGPAGGSGPRAFFWRGSVHSTCDEENLAMLQSDYASTFVGYNCLALCLRACDGQQL